MNDKDILLEVDKLDKKKEMDKMHSRSGEHCCTQDACQDCFSILEAKFITVLCSYNFKNTHLYTVDAITHMCTMQCKACNYIGELPAITHEYMQV